MINLWYNKPWFWPNSWWWIRVIIPYDLRFYNASLEHDVKYTIWGSEINKEMADLWLLNDMLLACDSRFQTLFAYLYYYLIYMFWFTFFNYN